jgi:heptosyltransferase-2
MTEPFEKRNSGRVYTETPPAAPSVSSRRVQAAREILAKARRIAVVTKFRFMGDTIVATPFLTQLRRHYPQAHLTLLTAPTVVEAFQNCPDLDEMIPVQIRGISRWRHTHELLGLLRGGRYEAVFLLNRSLHCAAICSLAGIPVRIGYANEFRGPLLTVPIPYFFDRNEVDSHLDMLRAIDLPVEDALPELWVSDAERERGLQILAEQGWNRDMQRPLIGIQPGANDPEIREWRAERYAHVADQLAAETGGRVVLMGGSAESRAVQAMSDAMRDRPLSLVGALQLREALAVIGLCDLWIGNDTGLLHAAVAQRVASVGLFGPNKVVRWGYEAPRHRSLVVIPDYPVRNDAAVRRCLDAITEEQVLETAREVLRRPRSEDGIPFSRPPYYAATLASTRSAPRR